VIIQKRLERGAFLLGRRIVAKALKQGRSYRKDGSVEREKQHSPPYYVTCEPKRERSAIIELRPGEVDGRTHHSWDARKICIGYGG